MLFGDTILIDQTEILIGEWLDYIYYNKPSEYPTYLKTRHNHKLSDFEKEKLKKQKNDQSLFPDLEVIKSFPGSYVFQNCEKCELITFSSIATKIQLPVNADSLKDKDSKNRLMNYLFSPVTGITYEQAIKFCAWRTLVDSLRYFEKSLDGYYAYVYDLPTPQFIDAINPNQDSIANKKGIIANYNYKNSTYSIKKKHATINEDCGKTLINAHSFFDSNKSVVSSTRDMQGNAAEMTKIKGIAKGGSFHHFASQSMKGIDNYYSQPEVWLGFRCIARPRKINAP